MGREIRGSMPSPKGNSPKVNVMARLEFELAYYDVVVQYVNHDGTGTRSPHPGIKI